MQWCQLFFQRSCFTLLLTHYHHKRCYPSRLVKKVKNYGTSSSSLPTVCIRILKLIQSFYTMNLLKCVGLCSLLVCFRVIFWNRFIDFNRLSEPKDWKHTFICLTVKGIESDSSESVTTRHTCWSPYSYNDIHAS